MIIFHQIVEAAKANGVRQLERHAPPTERLTKPDDLVDFMVSTTIPTVEPSARLLLKKMAERKWYLIRGIHTSKDPTPHATVSVKKRLYHLRLNAGGALCDITYLIDGNDNPQRLTGLEPWLKPGA